MSTICPHSVIETDPHPVAFSGGLTMNQWRCAECAHPFVPLRQTHCVHGKGLYDELCAPCADEAVAAETLRDPDAQVVTVFKRTPIS